MVYIFTLEKLFLIKELQLKRNKVMGRGEGRGKTTKIIIKKKGKK